MGQFSVDGQWWWDGTTWVATTQVVLPQLPVTEFERTGKLEIARSRRKKSQWLFWANGVPPLAWLTGPALIIVGRRASRDYRLWTIQQLALATAYLVGPDEPMVAGEGGTLISDTDLPPWRRDLAVAVTGAHVLVFRFDSVDGQPRWIAMAARLTDVKMQLRSGMDAFSLGPALLVSGPNGQWAISGLRSAFKPVLDAWRQAQSAAT